MGCTARSLRCAVVGAGMAGILAVIALRRAGFEDVTVFEKADRVGGTWRENTYPGLSCDVPSHLYSYSFELWPEWSHRFAPGAEIEGYLERVAADYDVLPRVWFGEEVLRSQFTGARWEIETSTGRIDEFDVVIAATGVLHRPRYPDVAKLESFGGRCFHSARWDHDAVLDGARVGVVGTGSTAVQIVSAIVDRVESLSLFQRTAQWVLPQENPAYGAEQMAVFRADPEVLSGERETQMATFDVFSSAVVDAESPALRLIEQICLENLEQSVHDPELRELLRPSYRAACKRLIVSPDFYRAIQRPNAKLVTAAIDRAEPNGLRTRDGEVHDLDVLVLATGFETDAFVRPMQVVGRDGIALDEAWDPRPVAYLSVSVPGFPNFFMLNGPNGPVGNFSLIEVAELQMAYLLQLLEPVRAGRCQYVSATAAALSSYEQAREEASRRTVWVTGCNSWYLDDRGLPAVWPWPFGAFRDAMAAPDFSAYELV